MTIKILFDKTAQNKNLHTGWGVSFLVDGRILFDTGEKGEWLLTNMRLLGVGLEKIDTVVISHDHWDHTGGLREILKSREGLKVFSCPGFSKEFKDQARSAGARLVESKKFTVITQNIFVTGEITGFYRGQNMPEQALALKTENGITVITGCAHPGIVTMIKKVKTHFTGESLYCVFGGFHLKEFGASALEAVVKDLISMGVEKVGPTHCSGEKAEEIFKKYYKENYISIEAGQDIEV